MILDEQKRVVQGLATSLLVVTFTTAAVCWTGCRHVGPPADEEVKNGDEDDTDLPTDFDTSAGFCDSEPKTCDDVGPDPIIQYMGCCHEGGLYWCWEQDQVWVDSIDCELNGGICGYDLQSQWMDCIYD